MKNSHSSFTHETCFPLERMAFANEIEADSRPSAILILSPGGDLPVGDSPPRLQVPLQERMSIQICPSSAWPETPYHILLGEGIGFGQYPFASGIVFKGSQGTRADGMCNRLSSTPGRRGCRTVLCLMSCVQFWLAGEGRYFRKGVKATWQQFHVGRLTQSQKQP